MLIKQCFTKTNYYITRLAIQNDQTTHWIKIFSLFFQLLTLFVIINIKLLQYQILLSKIFQLLFHQSQYINYLIIVLIFALIINLFFKISFFKSYYLIIVHIALDWDIYQKILIYLILGVGLVIEIISNTESTFYTQNIFAQKNNSIKIIHFLINITIVILRYFISNQMIFAIIVFGIYTVMLILRIVNQMNHHFVKKFFEFTYLLYLSSGLWNLLIQQFQLRLSKQQFIIIILIQTILIFNIKNWVYNQQLRAEKIQTDKQLIETIREIITYVYSNNYSVQTKNSIEKYIQINKNELNLPNGFKLDIDSQDLFLKRLSEVLNSYMHNDNFSHLLLKAQIQFKIKRNYYNTIKLIRNLENNHSIRNVINKILLCKLKNQIYNEIRFFYNCFQVGIYELVLQNDKFIQTMYQGAINYKKLWMMITDSQVIVENVENLMISVLNSNAQLQEQYNKLKMKNKHSIMLYFYYTFMVQRTNSKSIKLFNQHEFFIQNLPCDNQNHLIIQVSLQKDSLGDIQKISPNIQGKLGYQPKQLLNQNINLLVPQFFRKFHDQRIQQVLSKSEINQLVYNLQKKSLCQNINKELKQIQLNFRLVYNREQDKLSALGYVKIQENLSNFIVVFIKQSGNIIYMGDMDYKINIIQYSKNSYQTILYQLQKKKQIQLEIPNYHKGLPDQSNILTFVVLKQVAYTNNSNIIILKLKQDIDMSYILFKGKDKRECFTKYKLNKTSSIPDFFIEKKRICKQQSNNRTLITRIIILILLTCIILIIMIYFVNLNGVKTQKKLEVLEWGQNLYLQQVNILRLFIWNYYLYFSQQGINFPFLDYTQKPIQQFLPVILINNYDLLLMGQNSVTQNTISGVKHTIKVYDLIQSLQSSMSYINSNYNDTKSFTSNMMNQSRQYIFLNQKIVFTDCMPAWESKYKDVTDVIKGNYDMLYLLCTLMQSLFTILLSIFIIVFERQQSKKYSKVITIISQIKNQDRFQFTESIRLFTQKITYCSKPQEFYNQIIKNSHYKRKSQKDSELRKIDHQISNNSLIGSPNSQSSRINFDNNSTHRLFFRSSIISTARVQINKSISNALDDIVSQSQKTVVKVKPIKAILALKVIIGFVIILIISTLNYLYTKSPDYLTSSYIDNIFIQKNKVLFYQQKIEYFMRAVKTNFTTLEDFYSIYASQSNFNKQGQNFKITLTQFPQFDSFNRYYNLVQYQPICTYINCTIYANLLNNTIQTITLFNSGYLMEFMNQSSNYLNNSSALLQVPQILFTLYTQQLFAKIQLNLSDLYFECLKVYTSKIQKNVDNYLYILIGLTVGYFIVITMPELWDLVHKKKIITEFLDLLDQKIYKDIF